MQWRNAATKNLQIKAIVSYHNVTETSELLGIFHSSICLCCMFPGSVSRDGPPCPSPELLASLQSLRDNSDYTVLPHSLHQVCVCLCVGEWSRGNMCLYLVRQNGFVWGVCTHQHMFVSFCRLTSTVCVCMAVCFLS